MIEELKLKVNIFFFMVLTLVPTVIVIYIMTQLNNKTIILLLFIRHTITISGYVRSVIVDEQLRA